MQREESRTLKGAWQASSTGQERAASDTAGGQERETSEAANGLRFFDEKGPLRSTGMSRCGRIGARWLLAKKCRENCEKNRRTLRRTSKA